jgi:uncharacterized membrane protein
MWLLISIISAILFAIASFIITIGTKRNYSISQMLLGLYISGAIMFGLYVLSQNRIDFSYQILLWGFIISLGSSLGNAFFSYAVKTGPISLTAPLSNTNVIIVIAMSVFYYGEVLTNYQTLAITLILAACFILPFDPDENKNVKNKVWFVIIILTIFFLFLLNGGLKITKELKLDNSLVLFYSYMFSMLSFLVFTRFLPKKNAHNWEKPALKTGLLAGVFSFLGLQLYSYALLIGPASVVVPIFSSRNIAVAMMCLIYFQEKLSMYQKIALGSLLGGLVLVNF